MVYSPRCLEPRPKSSGKHWQNHTKVKQLLELSFAIFRTSRTLRRSIWSRPYDAANFRLFTGQMIAFGAPFRARLPCNLLWSSAGYYPQLKRTNKCLRSFGELPILQDKHSSMLIGVFSYQQTARSPCSAQRLMIHPKSHSKISQIVKTTSIPKVLVEARPRRQPLRSHDPSLVRFRRATDREI